MCARERERVSEIELVVLSFSRHIHVKTCLDMHD